MMRAGGVIPGVSHVKLLYLQFIVYMVVSSRYLCDVDIDISFGLEHTYMPLPMPTPQ